MTSAINANVVLNDVPNIINQKLPFWEFITDFQNAFRSSQFLDALYEVWVKNDYNIERVMQWIDETIYKRFGVKSSVGKYTARRLLIRLFFYSPEKYWELLNSENGFYTQCRLRSIKVPCDFPEFIVSIIKASAADRFFFRTGEYLEFLLKYANVVHQDKLELIVLLLVANGIDISAVCRLSQEFMERVSGIRERLISHGVKIIPIAPSELCETEVLPEEYQIVFTSEKSETAFMRRLVRRAGNRSNKNIKRVRSNHE